MLEHFCVCSLALRIQFKIKCEFMSSAEAQEQVTHAPTKLSNWDKLIQKGCGCVGG